MSEATFNQIDTDGDGKLTNLEVLKWQSDNVGREGGEGEWQQHTLVSPPAVCLRKLMGAAPRGRSTLVRGVLLGRWSAAQAHVRLT